MHLIINSLDTRRWMSDGVSSRGVEERGGARGGKRKGFVAEVEVGWRMEARARKGGGAEGRVNGEGEGEGVGGGRGEGVRRSDCRRDARERGSNAWGR